MPLLATWKEYAEYTAANVDQEGDTFSKYDPSAVPDESYFENLFEDAIKVAEERGVEGGFTVRPSLVRPRLEIIYFLSRFSLSTCRFGAVGRTTAF